MRAGIQPIEVVLRVMRNAWEQRDYKTAAVMAEVALAHTDPRLAATTITQKSGLDELSLDELRELLAYCRSAAQAEHQTPSRMQEELQRAGDD